MSKQWAHWGVELLVAGLLFAVALGVRAYDLHEIPPGLWLDEAANGLDVLEINQGHYALFFPRNNGREPLFLYLQALLVHWLGATPYALRLAAALVGAATVPALYWLARALFAEPPLRSSGIALWSALFLTFSYWHIALSRIGLRAIMLPLLTALAFTFFWRAWRKVTQSGPWPWADLLLCGLLVGGTLYTYTAGRFVPILVALTVFIGLLSVKPTGAPWPGQSASPWRPRRRLLLALGVIGLTALVVFAPLGVYFWHHPAAFVGRVADVSILNQSEADAPPLVALGRSALETAQMFATRPDPNLRHNPAARPVFLSVLSIWLLIGVAVALYHWRRLPYLFPLLWFGVLLLPAVLTAQGIPHSLRSLGSVPAAYLLPVLGMVWTGQYLTKRWGRVALWLPLPFLLFCATADLRDYWGAWQDLDKFRTPFLIDYVASSERIVQASTPDTVWVLPLSATYVLSEATWPTFYTVEFLLRSRVGYGSVVAAEQEAPATLARVTQGYRFASLFRLRDLSFFADSPFVFDDAKNLVAYLLQKHGLLVKESDGSDLGLPYTRYALPPDATYTVMQQPAAQEITFAHADQAVKLLTSDYGHTRLALDEATSALQEKRTPAGHTLWAALHWQAQTPIAVDLKASLLLKDAAGHLAGQVDQLLVGDHYPALRVWAAGETAGSYHILPVLPAIAPGQYQLNLRVYDEATGQLYMVQDAAGKPLGAEVTLGAVRVEQSRTLSPTAPLVTPSQPLTDQPRLAPEVALLGYDLPRPQLAPGDTLPVTLYWQALGSIAADYTISMSLRTADGGVIAAQQSRPGNGSYPTTTWRADEQLRDWHDLTIPATTPTGLYDLVVGLSAGQQRLDAVTLTQVEVSGRPRRFTPPPLAQALTTTFAQQVRLLGLDVPPTLSGAPGAPLTLTLVWQALATAPPPLVRFVHLLAADGRPVAQQDTIPCDSACPATSWLTDEILLDPVQLSLPADLAPGAYRLAVGWYDPQTQQRLAGADAQGAPLADQLLILPVAVTIEKASP